MTVFMAAIEHLLLIDRNPERRQLLGMADVSAKRLRALIDDILDFSRIEARKVEIEEEPFDLRACVRETVALFTLPAREKNLALESEVSADIPEKVLGDPNRLGQVLINLIGNAVKFTREGGVRVGVRPNGDLLEFSVADTGIGIPKEKRPLIFESFSQIDMSFHRPHEGSGLGLAISKGLVELMGGEISFQSRTGGGSVFTFTVPLRTVAGGDRIIRTRRPAEMGRRRFRPDPDGLADARNEWDGSHAGYPRAGERRRKAHLHHRPDRARAARSEGGVPRLGNGSGSGQAGADTISSRPSSPASPAESSCINGVILLPPFRGKEQMRQA